MPRTAGTPMSSEQLLRRIIALAHEELPFAASIAQLALQASTGTERHAVLDALYRIALEHQSPYIGELVDTLLVDLERLQQHAS